MADFWKILRVLTTNRCNYRCIYCHNEGQEKNEKAELLEFDSFCHVISAVEGMGFKEIRFSGGEPLINPQTIDMIEWVNNNTDYEVGLATNGSLVTKGIAERLGNTRTLVTVHFPSTKEEEYTRITGKEISGFWDGVANLENCGVSFSYNHVLHPDCVENLEDVIESVIKEKKRVKILPYIESGFNNLSEKYILKLCKDMDEKAENKSISGKDGIISWRFSSGGKVKLLESPCYDHNISRCKEYAELRLLPNLTLQRCIFDSNTVSIKGMENEEIRKTISELWCGFNHCI